MFCLTREVCSKENLFIRTLSHFNSPWDAEISQEINKYLAQKHWILVQKELCPKCEAEFQNSVISKNVLICYMERFDSYQYLNMYAKFGLQKYLKKPSKEYVKESNLFC